MGYCLEAGFWLKDKDSLIKAKGKRGGDRGLGRTGERKCILLFLDGMSYISIKSFLLNVSFEACVSLFIFILDDLSVGETRVLFWMECPTYQ